MKKLSTLLSLAIAAMTGLVSCNKQETADSPSYDYTFAIGGDTKAVLSDDDIVTWTSSDVIGVYAEGSSNLSSNVKAGHPATFNVRLSSPLQKDDVLHFYYPYSSTAGSASSQVQMSIPASQKGDLSALPMASLPYTATAAVANGDEVPGVSFCVLGAIVELNIWSSESSIRAEKVTSVAFSANDGIAGDFKLNLASVDADAPSSLSIGSLSGKEVTVTPASSVNPGSSKTASSRVAMVVAPGTHSGTLTVTTDGGKYVYDVPSSSYKRASIKPLYLCLDAAHKQGGQSIAEGTVLWAETWAGCSDGSTPSTNTNGTTVYGGGKISYSYTNGSTQTKLYDASLAGGSAPELLLNKGKGTFTVSGIPVSGASSVILSFKANNVFTAFANIEYSVDGSSMSPFSLDTKSGSTITLKPVAVNGSSMTIRFTGNSGSTNIRMDDFELVTAGSSTAVDPTKTKLVMSSISCSASTTSLTFTWPAVANASGYGVVFDNDEETVITSTTWVVNGLAEGSAHTIKVRALSADETRYVDSDYKTLSCSTAMTHSQDPTGKGWFELPAIVDADSDGRLDQDNSLYYAYHIAAGGEKAAGGQDIRNFTVCYSATEHCPVWVAAPRHRLFVGSSGRNDSYRVDPNIPSSIQYSSKDTGGNCNKGHMLGSAERTSSVATNKQVFYYTNIAPQDMSTFNTGGGAWNLLEDFIDGQVCADTLYEVVGCYFKEYTDAYGIKASPKKIAFGGRTDVSKPTMFYYAVLRTKKGNSGKSVKDCTADELQCAAFVMSHYQEKGHKPQAKDIISISELEALTGFTYFTNVPNAPKSTFKASDWGL